MTTAERTLPYIRRRPVAAPPAVEKKAPVATSGGATHLLRPESAWTWEELRDYVLRQIEQRYGAQPRDSVKEASIFRSYITRWGADAVRIAKFAFEDCDGKWKGAPIRVNRFCKGADEYFSAEILAHLSA